MRVMLILGLIEHMEVNWAMLGRWALGLGFFLVAVTPGHAQMRTLKSDIADPAKFERLSVKTPVAICTGEITSCGKRVVSERELKVDFQDCGAECPTLRDEVFFFNSGVAIFLRTISRLPDDSVDAVRYRAAFKKVQGGYQFVQLGSQHKCGRGPNRNKWTTKLCP